MENEPDNSSLWIWKSKRGYWNSNRDAFVKDKKDATVKEWMFAKLSICVGDGEWVSADDETVTIQPTTRFEKTRSGKIILPERTA